MDRGPPHRTQGEGTTRGLGSRFQPPHCGPPMTPRALSLDPALPLPHSRPRAPSKSERGGDRGIFQSQGQRSSGLPFHEEGCLRKVLLEGRFASSSPAWREATAPSDCPGDGGWGCGPSRPSPRRGPCRQCPLPGSAQAAPPGLSHHPMKRKSHFRRRSVE